MSQGGDTADMMVREGIEITEAAVKLAALGAKNLAAILLALSQDEHKKAGPTSIARLLKDGQALKVLPIKAEDLARFSKEAKQYGILCSSIKDRSDPEGNADIVIREGDVGLCCRILERMGYALPEEEKNKPSRARQESRSTARGTTSKASAPGMKIEGMEAEKPSVVKNIEAIKRAAGKSGPKKPGTELSR